MLIRVQENADWIVDYDTDNHLYKVSYFEDYHFVDQCRFNCCEERSITSAEAIGLYYKTLIRVRLSMLVISKRITLMVFSLLKFTIV